MVGILEKLISNNFNPQRPTQPSAESTGAVVGSPALMRWDGRRSYWTAPSPDRRVFQVVSVVQASSVKAALSRPTHQPSPGCYATGTRTHRALRRGATQSPEGDDVPLRSAAGMISQTVSLLNNVSIQSVEKKLCCSGTSNPTTGRFMTL